MSVQKVPQDVEADDKFLGPLSFKQFIFAGIALTSGFLVYYCISINLWPVSVLFVPPFVVSGFLAFPWSKEQPTEVWLAARIRFLIKQRKRIWDQSGVKQLVTVTAPARPEHLYTDGLDQDQVRTRFNALANIVDSRGWAIKNTGGPQALFTQPPDNSDRLVAGTMPAPTELQTIAQTTDDVLDESTSVIAKQFDTMIEDAEKEHKNATMQLVEQARQRSAAEAAKKQQALEQTPVIPPQPSQMITPTVVPPGDSAAPPSKPPIIARSDESYWFDEPAAAIIKHPPQHATSNSQPPSNSGVYSSIQTAPMQTTAPIATPIVQPTLPAVPMVAPPLPPIAPVQPVTSPLPQNSPTQPQAQQAAPLAQPVPVPYQPVESAEKTQSQSPKVETPDPAILELANTNHLDVATLSRQANKKKDLPSDSGEVIISLR